MWNEIGTSSPNVTDDILRNCDLWDQMRIAATNSINNAAVRKYIQGCLDLLGSCFFDNSDILLEILWTCNSLISGEIALQFLLPETCANWCPADLHFYIPSGRHICMYRLLCGQGYTMVKEVVLDRWPHRNSIIAHICLGRSDYQGYCVNNSCSFCSHI